MSYTFIRGGESREAGRQTFSQPLDQWPSRKTYERYRGLRLLRYMAMAEIRRHHHHHRATHNRCQLNMLLAVLLSIVAS